MPRLKDGKRFCRVSKCDKLTRTEKKYGGCCAWCARVVNNTSGEDIALPSRSRPGQGRSLQQKNAKRTVEERQVENAKTEQDQAMNAKRKEDAMQCDEQRMRIGSGIINTPYYCLSRFGKCIE